MLLSIEGVLYQFYPHWLYIGRSLMAEEEDEDEADTEAAEGDEEMEDDEKKKDTPEVVVEPAEDSDGKV